MGLSDGELLELRVCLKQAEETMKELVELKDALKEKFMATPQLMSVLAQAEYSVHRVHEIVKHHYRLLDEIYTLASKL